MPREFWTGHWRDEKTVSIKALKSKLTIATEALELIAATNLVGINLEEYFFGLSKDELAECVCHDTATAREALAKIDGET